MKPSFTVILVTYRRFDYFVQALSSILGQTFRDFECLIFNDFPDDNEKIADYISTLNDQRLVFHPSHQSLGGNHWRNRGISLAQGEIIAFLDDDDRWLETKLEKHFTRHQEVEGKSLVFSDYYKFFPELNKMLIAKNASLYGDAIHEMAQGKFSISTTSSVTIRGLDDTSLFDENLPSFQDWDAWFHLRRTCGDISFIHIQEPLIYFTQHTGERVSKNKEKRTRALILLKEKYETLGIDVSGFFLKEKLHLELQDIEKRDMSMIAQIFAIVHVLVKYPAMLIRLYTYKRVRRHFFR